MSLVPIEIIGGFVQELRERRKRGAPASELARFLMERGVGPTLATNYFKIAFNVSLANFLYLYGEGGLDYDAVGELSEGAIEEARETWSVLPAYPDLASRRDREAFRAFARRRGAYVLVCALDPARDLPQPSPCYVLHGVYAKDTRANLWRPGTGEAIRSELNIAFGGELIRSGPQDPWEFRNDLRAVERSGPKVPVNCFEPGGNVEDLLDVESLEDWYEYRSFPWPFSEEPQPT